MNSQIGFNVSDCGLRIFAKVKSIFSILINDHDMRNIAAILQQNAILIITIDASASTIDKDNMKSIL